MSLNMRLGKRGNLLQPGPGSYNQLLLETPILVESELEAIKTSSGLSSKVLVIWKCPTFQAGLASSCHRAYSPLHMQYCASPCLCA